MKRSVIVLILLSALIGCERDSSITIRNEQKTRWTQDSTDSQTIMDKKTLGEGTSQNATTGGTSPGAIAEEPDYWVDESLGLRFAPLAGMSVVNDSGNHKGLIAIFTNDAGHTFGILDATAAYPGMTWSEINQKLSEMKDCGDGFYERILARTTKNAPMVQLLRCVRNGEKIYLVQAYASQKTYGKVAERFRTAMKSLSFDE